MNECPNCHQEIPPDPEKRVFVVIGSLDEANEPIVVDTQTADKPLQDGMLMFNSIVCIKKWLLQWVDAAADRTPPPAPTPITPIRSGGDAA